MDPRSLSMSSTSSASLEVPEDFGDAEDAPESGEEVCEDVLEDEDGGERLLVQSAVVTPLAFKPTALSSLTLFSLPASISVELTSSTTSMTSALLVLSEAAFDFSLSGSRDDFGVEVVLRGEHD